MSGFFGVFSPGGNLDQVAFDQMKSAVHRYGYDELETYIDDQIAMGHLMLRATPESMYDKQPLKSDCGRYTLVGHFRLDYRDELGDKLGMAQKELELTPDSMLVMKSYQKWENNCVHHIEGDWAFVLYDSIKNTITCCKDKYGTSAFFYTFHDSQFYFSSSIHVFSYLKPFALNLDLHQLYRMSFNGLDFEKNKTLLKDVLRLSPCSRLSVSCDLSCINFTYFDFPKSSPIRFKDELDYILNFRSLYSNTIRSKMRGIDRVGVFQSSGLDSNSILYFVSKELEYLGKSVNTYTSCNAYMDRIESKYHSYISDDLLLKESLKAYKNVNAKFLSFKESDFKNEFKDSLEDFNYPIVSKSKFWLKGILQHAKSDGVVLMFTGQLGNFTITWNNPNAILSDLIGFRISSAIKQLREIAKKSKRNLMRITWAHIGVPIKSFLKHRINILLCRKEKELTKSSIFLVPITNKINWKCEFKAENSILSIPSILDSVKMRKELIKINAEVTGTRWFLAGFERSIVVTDPTIDIRLLDFLINLPSKYYYFNGKQKYLFRKVFDGRMYAPILNNDFTIQQSFDLGHRILSDSFFNNYLDQIENDENEIIDIKSLKQDYLDISSAKTDFKKYISAMKFLKNFSIVYIYNTYGTIQRRS
jgi:asparagine synthase (glutamine-hydrolysing)